jgi:hypothetical protein
LACAALAALDLLAVPRSDVRILRLEAALRRHLRQGNVARRGAGAVVARPRTSARPNKPSFAMSKAGSSITLIGDPHQGI